MMPTEDGVYQESWIINDKKMRIILIFILDIIPFMTIKAQYVTYNHDNTKMNQITIMETGAGSLTPELYYRSLHNQYRKTAAMKNKLGYRTETAASSYLQIDIAAKIDSALTKRAEIEALNIADREIDLAWNAEQQKIETAMQSYSDNIRRLTEVGGNPTEQEHWLSFYNIYTTAIKATREAYMPNSQRKRQYLQIYEDIRKKNELLIAHIVKVYNNKKTNQALNASLDRENKTATIAEESKNNWRQRAISDNK